MFENGGGWRGGIEGGRHGEIILCYSPAWRKINTWRSGCWRRKAANNGVAKRETAASAWWRRRRGVNEKRIKHELVKMWHIIVLRRSGVSPAAQAAAKIVAAASISMRLLGVAKSVRVLVGRRGGENISGMAASSRGE